MGDFAEGFEMLVPSAAEDLSKEARESLSLLPDLWAPATSPVMAFAADGDSQVRFVFGPGRFSAVRDLAGAWRSPAPDCKVGDFAEGFEMLVPSAAEALSKEACGALLGTGSI